MKIGICTSIDQIELVQRIGFDYIEPAVVGIAQMNKKEYEEVLTKVDESKIGCEVFNILFPGEIRLTGPNVNHESIREYLVKAFDRIAKLGAKAVVFGSGGARRIPEDLDPKDGWKDLVETARVVGEVASQYNIIIAMEPLNKSETNILNSVSEGISFVKEVDHTNIRLLADFYHMRVENESMDILKETNSDILVHTHIAKGDGRYFPICKDEDIYSEFFYGLKEIAYESRVSIEGRTDNFEEDAAKALEVLRELAK